MSWMVVVHILCWDHAACNVVAVTNDSVDKQWSSVDHAYFGHHFVTGVYIHKSFLGKEGV